MKKPHSDGSEAGDNGTGSAKIIIAVPTPRLYVASMLEHVRALPKIIHSVHLIDPIAAEFGLPVVPLTYCEDLPASQNDTDIRVAYRALVWGLEVARKELHARYPLEVLMHQDRLLASLMRGQRVSPPLKPYHDDVRYCERNFQRVEYRWVAAAQNPARNHALAHLAILKEKR